MLVCCCITCISYPEESYCDEYARTLDTQLSTTLIGCPVTTGFFFLLLVAGSVAAVLSFFLIIMKCVVKNK